MSPTIQLTTETVEVTKEVNDVGLAIEGVMGATAQALKDGWQPGEDIPAIMLEAYQKVPEAIKNLNLAKGEFRGEPIKAGMGALIPVARGMDALILKD